MARGRIGRVPAVIDMLKRAKRPMSAHEIAAQFRERGDEHCSYKTIGETLRKIVWTKPDVGIRRATRRGFYVYLKEYDVPVTATRNRSDELPRRTPSARVREIREERALALGHPLPPADDTPPSIEQLEMVRNKLSTVNDYAAVDVAFSTAMLNEGVGPLQPKVSMDASWASAHPFPFTRIRIVRTLADGRVLFIDDPSGRAWVAKEV